MDSRCRNEIKNLISEKLRHKLETYSPESEHKPFFKAIFTNKQIVTASLIQSFYTTFGMGVYEQIAVILASYAGFYAEKQYTLYGQIDPYTDQLIYQHWLELRTNLKNKQPFNCSKEYEFKMIYDNIQKGNPCIDNDSTVDLYIKKSDGSEFFFDITTVKNNLKSFDALKLKLMRWIGLRLSIDKNAKPNTFIAIPYNPYYPKPYLRWNSTILDDSNDMLIQEDFWNFVGNDENTYSELLDIFEEVGNELRYLIDSYFNQI